MIEEHLGSDQTRGPVEQQVSGGKVGKGGERQWENMQFDKIDIQGRKSPSFYCCELCTHTTLSVTHLGTLTILHPVLHGIEPSCLSRR